MRQASHNILYGVANSNAMDERNFSTPGWVKTLYTVDAVIILLLILLEVYVIRKFLVLRKKEESAEA
jgi:beta-glucosidase